MVVLDTNVISELMKETPEPRVLRWVDSQVWSEIFTTAITRAELLYGIHILPVGGHRRELETRMARVFEDGLHHRVIAFDSLSALHFARIRSRRRSFGREIREPDAMIAAICAQHGLPVATRNVADFSNFGIDVVNPWTD